MNFKIELPIAPFQKQVSIEDSVLFMGSCFAENINQKLKDYKFDTFCNPSGILFNPLSIANTLHTAIQGNFDFESLVFEHQDLWYSWWHHGSVVGKVKEDLLTLMMDSNLEANKKLKNANWLFITWGSAFVYEHLPSQLLVANCHKVPGNQFKKRLLDIEEIVAIYDALIELLNRFNPELKIVFNLSPVRYTRDGLHENNLSKSTLFLALNTLQKKHKNLLYFPSYEVVIDELRDYRFYEEDWSHPNSLAINYVWSRFMETCMDSKTLDFIKSYDPILKSKKHRPINSHTKAHEKFREDTLKKVLDLQSKYFFLNWQDDLDFFAKQ